MAEAGPAGCLDCRLSPFHRARLMQDCCGRRIIAAAGVEAKGAVPRHAAPVLGAGQ